MLSNKRDCINTSVYLYFALFFLVVFYILPLLNNLNYAFVADAKGFKQQQNPKYKPNFKMINDSSEFEVKELIFNKKKFFFHLDKFLNYNNNENFISKNENFNNNKKLKSNFKQNDKFVKINVNGQKVFFDKNENSYFENAGSMVNLPVSFQSKQKFMHISVVNYADNQIVYDVDNILLVNHVNIQKTYIYATVLDENFEVIDNFRYLNQFYPRILDIKQPLGDDLIGPHDTRTLIDNGGNIIITFNMDDANGERLIWTFNITTGELRKMYYELALGPQSWIGFVNKKNEVQFIYSWEPKISILNCNSGSCIEIMSDNDEFGTEERDIDMNHPETLKSTGIKKKAKSLKKSFSLRSFRGGSSLTSYKDYYISLVRIRSMDPNNSNAPPVFRSRLAILDRNFAIVFISENLDFQNLLFLEPFFKKTSKDPKNFFCSYASLLKGSSINKLKNGLDWVLEFSINDQKNVLVVVKNLTPFFDSIIQKYEAGKFSTWNIRDLVDDELHNIQWCSESGINDYYHSSELILE